MPQGDSLTLKQDRGANIADQLWKQATLDGLVCILQLRGEYKCLD